MKTILVTGGLGYFGSHIAYTVAARGYHVVLLDTKEPSSSPWATIAQGDCGDKQALQDLFTHYHITAVIHCAETHTSFPYTTNVAATLSLIESMIKHNVTQLLFKSHWLDESSAAQTAHAYDVSKHVIESILQELTASQKLATVILKHDVATGAFPEVALAPQSSSLGNPIPELLHAAHTQQPLHLNNLHISRDYLHIRDIADAYIKALVHLEQENPPDTFHLGMGQSISLQNIVACIEQITQRPIHYTTTQQQDGARRSIDVSRTCDLLEWKPRYSDLPFIIRSSITYYQRHGYQMMQPYTI